MHDLFPQGAVQGQTPRVAYFVERCQQDDRSERRRPEKREPRSRLRAGETCRVPHHQNQSDCRRYTGWPSEHQVLPELDARSKLLAIRALELENEGWEGHYDVKKLPTQPKAVTVSDTVS